MTYVIAEPCIDIKDQSCIDVCPVDCIHVAERMLVIDPEECIDCGACVSECPVEAIFARDALRVAIATERTMLVCRTVTDEFFVMLVMMIGPGLLVLLGVALVFTSWVIDLLAPGFSKDPGRFALAVELTRITFPYLLLVSLVTLYGGILNALGRFASAAAAPILLNLSMMMTLALAVFFPSAGHAAAWGVLIAGILETLLVGGDAFRQCMLPKFCLMTVRTPAKRKSTPAPVSRQAAKKSSNIAFDSFACAIQARRG